MALTSRRQRELEQRKRMLRGKRNLSQLAGPQAQGGRRPMQQGYTKSSVVAPKFQESNVGNDIMQAGLAFKGGKGIHDFAMGKEAYTDKAGNFVPARAPFSFGDKSILGEGGHVDEYFGKVGNRWNEATEGAKGLFGTPTPQPGRVPAAGGGFFGSTTPTSPASGYGHAIPGSSSALQAAEYANSPALQTMNKFNLAGDISGPTTGLYTQQGILGGSAAGGMGGIGGMGGSAGAGSNLLGGSGSAFAGANAAGNTATAVNAATKGAEAASTAAEAGSGLQGASGGQPWLAYANIGKDLIMGGPGSEKITGSTAGDAAIRAAAAYFTFGLSEIPYAFI